MQQPTPSRPDDKQNVSRINYKALWSCVGVIVLIGLIFLLLWVFGIFPKSKTKSSTTSPSGSEVPTGVPAPTGSPVPNPAVPTASPTTAPTATPYKIETSCVLDGNTASSCYDVSDSDFEYYLTSIPDEITSTTYGSVFYYGPNSSADPSNCLYDSKDGSESCEVFSIAPGGGNLPITPYNNGTELLISTTNNDCKAITKNFFVGMMNNDSKTLNISANFIIYPTGIDSTNASCTTEDDASVDFGAFSAQKYLVIYANTGVFANQYPLFLMHDENGTPYSYITINNLVVQSDAYYKLFFYITDAISDLPSIYTQTGQGNTWVIDSDPNCIASPLAVVFSRLGWSTITATPTAAALEAKIDCTPTYCYSDPPETFTYENNSNSIVIKDGNSYIYGTGLSLIEMESACSSVYEVNGSEFTINSCSGAPIALLLSATDNPITLSMTVKVEPFPSVEGTEDWPPAPNAPSFSVLVIFTDDGSYANQFPLFYGNVLESGTTDKWLQVANVAVNNLIVESTKNVGLYFYTSDSFMNLSSLYSEDSDGLWTVSSENLTIPNKITIKSIAYV